MDGLKYLKFNSYYNTYVNYRSVVDLIMDGNITPFSRMKRKSLSEEDKKALTDRDR